MKKIGIAALIVISLAACNSNTGNSSEGNNAGMNGTDTSRTPRIGDTTPTSNDNAYNTTDTGLSKGGMLDSSGKHTMMNQSTTNQNRGKKH